jgi:hypothetical protein
MNSFTRKPVLLGTVLLGAVVSLCYVSRADFRSQPNSNPWAAKAAEELHDRRLMTTDNLLIATPIVAVDLFRSRLEKQIMVNALGGFPPAASVNFLVLQQGRTDWDKPSP